jgi:hypothetical protein
MKRITAIALFAAASILGASSALAQDAQLRATMPFDFTVGGKHLPSGTYAVTRAFGTLIAVRNLDTSISALSAVSPASDPSIYEANDAKLVFDKIGDQYFLREIIGGYGNSLHATVPLSKSEQKARSLESFARNRSESQVTIAMR